MKLNQIIKQFFLSALILCGVFFSSCKNWSIRVRDYSFFPSGTIVSGKMADGNTFYLIREDATKMAGICFVDNNQAVVETFSFLVDSTGATFFTFGNVTYSGKMKPKPAQMEIHLTLPEIPALKIVQQTVRLNTISRISEKAECLECYKDKIFQEIVSKKNIQYGAATGYYTSKPSDYISKDDYGTWFREMFNVSLVHRGFLFKSNMQQLPLLLDIYHPKNDHSQKRPLILFIHGGAFFFGDKENKLQQIITDDLVKKGFILASINYRLGTSITPGSIERTIFRDVQDARAALRYLVFHKDGYRIDEEQIYLAGSSAGGIIALTTAFMDDDEVYSSTGRGLLNIRENLGGLDDSGNNLKTGFNIAGVVSMWGAVTNLRLLNNNIPTLLFHGTADNIVPSNEGLPFKDTMGKYLHNFLSLFGKLYGSEQVYQRLKSLDVPVKYVPFHGADHDPYIEPDESLNENMKIISSEIGNFLYENASKHYFPYSLSGHTAVRKSNFTPSYHLDNLNDATVQWFVDGGLITRQSADAIRVVWYSSYTTGVITACITNSNGDSLKKEMYVSINQ